MLIVGAVEIFKDGLQFVFRSARRLFDLSAMLGELDASSRDFHWLARADEGSPALRSASCTGRMLRCSKKPLVPQDATARVRSCVGPNRFSRATGNGPVQLSRLCVIACG